MDEMLRLIQKNNIKAADVEKVEVGGNLSNDRTLFQHHPDHRPAGKIQHGILPWPSCCSSGKATLASFTDAVVQRSDVQDMIGRVHFAVDPQFNKRSCRARRCKPSWSSKAA